LDLLARKGPVGLMEQLYSVLRDQGIRYDLALFDPHPGITQRIRKPETILAEKTGTCLDLAVLFAGMYLAHDLLPLIVLVEGHAFAGVSRIRTRRDTSRRAGAFAFTRGYLNDLNRLRELARSEYVFVECTGCTQSTAALDARYPEGRGREASGYMSFE